MPRDWYKNWKPEPCVLCNREITHGEDAGVQWDDGEPVGFAHRECQLARLIHRQKP